MTDAPTTDARPWWRLPDTPVPGGVPDLARALLWAELAIVLLVSLGRSAVYSVVNLVAAIAAPGPLSAQGANLNNSLSRLPWLDLVYQLLRIGFALVPVALAAYLLLRSGTRVPVLVLAAAENAVLEEFVVLGFVQVRLRQLGFGDSAAIGMAAVLRGSYHLYQGLGGFVGNLAMGLLFGYLFRRWARVVPFVVAHTLLDVGAFVGYAVLAGRVDWLPTL